MKLNVLLVLSLFYLHFGNSLIGQDLINFDSLTPKLTLPLGHSASGVVYSNYSKDGKFLLTCGVDKTAKVWDLSTRKLIHNLTNHNGKIESGHFSPDNKYILTSSVDKTAKIWNAITGNLIHDLVGHKNHVVSSNFSPDGTSVITASWDGTAKIWDTKSGKLLHNLTGHKENVLHAEFSHDGSQVITTSFDGTAKVWDVQTGNIIHNIQGENEFFTTGKFGLDGKIVLTASSNGTVKIWDTESGNLLHSLTGHQSAVNEVLLSLNGKQVFTSGEDGVIIAWDILKGQRLTTLDGHKDEVLSIHLSPDGSQLVSVGNKGLAKVWDIKSGKLVLELKSKLRKTIFSESGDFKSAQFSPDGKHILTHGRGSSKIWHVKSGKLIDEFSSKSRSITQFSYSPDNTQIQILSRSVQVLDSKRDNKVWNPLLNRIEIEFPDNIIKSIFRPDGKQILSIDENHNYKVWDATNGKLIYVLKGEFSFDIENSYVEYSPDGKYILNVNKEGQVDKWDANTGRSIYSYQLPDFPEAPIFMNMKMILFRWSQDKKYLIVSTNTFVYLYDVNGRSLVNSIKAPPPEQSFEFMSSSKFPLECELSSDNKLLLTKKQTENNVKVFDSFSGELKQELKGHKDFITSAQFNFNGKQILTTSYDHTAKVWDVNSGNLIFDFIGHNAVVKQALYSPDDGQIATIGEDDQIKIWDNYSGELLFNLSGFTLSRGHKADFLKYNIGGNKLHLITNDGSVVFWDTHTGEKLIQLYLADQTNWIAIHPTGLFDASSLAMQFLYYVIGNEIIEFSQLKDRYYEPGLFEKVMAGETLRNVEAFEKVAMYPEVISKINNHLLTINLKIRNGGIGKISLFVNNKEVISDANKNRTSSISIDLTQFEKYYLKDATNSISIRAYNEAGWLKSSSFDHNYKPDFIVQKNDGERNQILNIVKHDPQLHAVIVGTSDYVGEILDLRFADKDSRDIALAVEQTASLLFGPEKVHIHWFTSNGMEDSKLGSKDNIKAAIDSIVSNAKVEDVLLFYFSGHGVTYGGSFENEQFFYLTKDVNSGDISDPQIRSTYTISSDELTGWINSIAAQKQVMILDACSSGKVVEDLFAVRNVPSSQIRALDRMKDRTGMFVLAGSAADKVSYEASQYGQGLLTYSLLLGMSGSALKDGKSVDVMELFQFARDRVPEFARDIGGVQTPTLASPIDASSFDIGLINEDIEIPIQTVKPLFSRSNFQEEDSFKDIIRLSKAMDSHLVDASSGPSARGIIFVDVDEYENAFSVNGRYKIDGIYVTIDGKIFKGKDKIGDFTLTENKNQLEKIVESILDKVENLINQ